MKRMGKMDRLAKPTSVASEAPEAPAGGPVEPLSQGGAVLREMVADRDPVAP